MFIDGIHLLWKIENTDNLPYFLYEIQGFQCDTAIPRRAETVDANGVLTILLSAKAAKIDVAAFAVAFAPPVVA